MTTNSLRAHRIRELSAVIHEAKQALRSHASAHPGTGAPIEERDAWLDRDAELRAELHHYRVERQREIERAEYEAATC